VDVMRCGDILDVTTCIYAEKDTFPNLIIDSLSSSSIMYCVWEGEKNACVSKNSIKGGLECNKFSIDVCDLFQGCAVVGGSVSLTVLNHSSFFFDLGICVNHPCPDDYSVEDIGTCPFGCVIDGSSPSSLSKSNKQLQHILKEIANNISYLNPTNNPLHNPNTTSLDNHLLMGEPQPICVLESCARHSVTDCLNHTEDTCFPSEDGCRFA
jgi:hypothetical protein